MADTPAPVKEFDPTSVGLGAASDVDPSTLPARKENRPDPSMTYFDGLVATAPRDKVRKYRTDAAHSRGLANRFGRALARNKLRDAFRVVTGTDADGVFVALQPKRAKKEKVAS